MQFVHTTLKSGKTAFVAYMMRLKQGNPIKVTPFNT